ncbi:MAG TPA: hypothetical protein VJ770_10710 [Stellaceae bacterium]|nr:hypothetical protein [Stellaceae bacterium]
MKPASRIAAIHDLFTRYCCALDNGEIETVVECFTGGSDGAEGRCRRHRRPAGQHRSPRQIARHLAPSAVRVSISG